jgi:hypothetical protein
MMETETSIARDYGPRRLNVELANICNLHCSYCFRADENLYSTHAEFFPIELLRRVIAEVDYIDPLGKALLAEMRSSGVEIIAHNFVTHAICEEIVAESEAPRKKG